MFIGYFINEGLRRVCCWVGNVLVMGFVFCLSFYFSVCMW